MVDAFGPAFTSTEKEPPMHASLTSVGVVGVALFVGCSQPISPTTPTSLSSASPSIASSDANATGAGLLSKDQEVPFKGRLEGAATITPLTPPFLSVSIEGTGNGTHLGGFTVEIPHVVNTTNRTSTGTYEFTAPNGDTLTAGFTGQASLTAPGVLSIVETATITGGTGRFADATGNFTVERLFNQITGLTTGSFEGTISSPGAGKP
jgi:hypothetical protein